MACKSTVSLQQLSCLGKYRPSREIAEEERLSRCLLIIIKYSVIVPGPGVQSAKQLDPALPQREWRKWHFQAVGSPGRQDDRVDSCPCPSKPLSLQFEMLSSPPTTWSQDQPPGREFSHLPVARTLAPCPLMPSRNMETESRGNRKEWLYFCQAKGKHSRLAPQELFPLPFLGNGERFYILM